jgi:hypothetical protein
MMRAIKRLAVAVTIVGLSGCGGDDTTSTPAPSTTVAPTPSTTPAPDTTVAPATTAAPPTTATANDVPQQLLDRWVGPPRDLGILGTGSAAAFVVIDDEFLELETGNADNPKAYSSTVAPDGDDALVLTLLSDWDDCHGGDAGHYRWAMTPGGTTLTLTAVDDACPARAVAIEGAWWHTGCNDPTRNCLGVVEAGTYATNRFNPFGEFTFGQLTYTVPDGWANSYDSQGSFFLEPASGYEGEADVYPNLAVWPDVTAPIQCTIDPDPSVALGAANLADWIEALPQVVVERTQIEIGDLPAEQLDVRIVSDEGLCTEELDWNGLVLTTSRAYPEPDAYGILKDQTMRLILVETEPQRTVAIYIDDSHVGVEHSSFEVDAAGNDISFEPLAAELMPIIESFRFSPTPPPM